MSEQSAHVGSQCGNEDSSCQEKAHVQTSYLAAGIAFGAECRENEQRGGGCPEPAVDRQKLRRSFPVSGRRE